MPHGFGLRARVDMTGQGGALGLCGGGEPMKAIGNIVAPLDLKDVQRRQRLTVLGFGVQRGIFVHHALGQAGAGLDGVVNVDLRQAQPGDSIGQRGKSAGVVVAIGPPEQET